MKTRVLKRGAFWYGEAYTYVLGTQCWCTITSPCYTRSGAIAAVKYWLSQRAVYEIS